jgi:hydroxymethylpyrimidine pyrophosphatase-like HAD family hydrolase
MQKKPKLVLCDVDKTIIGTDYRPNSPGLARSVLAVQNDGMLIGLNSDSPMLRMQEWAANFGMRGPIISELGGAFAYQDDTIFLRERDPWIKLFTLVINRIRLVFPNVRILSCDSTEFIRDVGDIDSPDSDWIILNSLRSVSFACLFRRLVNRSLVIDNALSESFSRFILSIVDEIGMRSYLSEPDVNHDYGIMILHEKGASKSWALSHIKEIFPNRQVYMIGDSMGDFLADKSIIQCAVGNASEEYKSHCQSKLVAPSDEILTKGVEYLLAHIAKV